MTGHRQRIPARKIPPPAQRQRGEATLALIAIAALLTAAYSYFAPPVGRFAIATDSQYVYRLDTATGQIERVQP